MAATSTPRNGGTAGSTSSPAPSGSPGCSGKPNIDGVYVMRKNEESKTSELFRLFVEVEKWADSPGGLSVDLAFNRP